MATPTKTNGILHTDYEANLARLDNFCTIESDWDKLLHRLVKASSDICYCDADGRKGTLRSLLENQVLTVLADISQKKLSGYGDAFADVQGTARQTFYIDKLRREIVDWIIRLDNYLHQSWKKGDSESSAVQTARKLMETLGQSLQNGSTTEKNGYYRMLRTVTAIQEQEDYYRQQIEESGDMESALSLLVAQQKNYSGIAEAFNRLLDTLPELYRHDILHAVPQATVQDNVYLIITPAAGVADFILPKGELFPAGQNMAGEDLIYQTKKEEYISSMQCVAVDAVSISQKGDLRLYKQSIPLEGTDETLFAHGEELRIGWQIESSMLVLNEGERKVNVYFCLTADSLVPDSISDGCFILQLSGAESWIEQSCNCCIEADCLCFEFTLEPGEVVPVPCTEEIHGVITEYPVLRILTDNRIGPYGWASLLQFYSVKIETRVTGIRNFTFCNELGDVDTSQSFQPFGIQAGKGAWFIFGYDEMGLKSLQEVCLKGTWKKLPETKEEFDKIYGSYGTNADAFRITAEWQQKGRWITCHPESQDLLTFDDQGKIRLAEMRFNCTEPKHDRFFRATLNAPAIGFGVDTYRTQFTDVMIHNSQCKKKDCKPIPTEPPVPQLAEVELSYIAMEEMSLTKIGQSSIRLSRITELSEQDTYPICSKQKHPFLPAFPADHLLYFAFRNARGEKSVRMYMDMTLPKENIPFYNLQPNKRVKLSWELWNGNSWKTIAGESIRIEETSGLTQSGFIEIIFPEKISDKHTDRQGRMWLRTALTGNVSACLAIRGIRTNCIRLEAQNSDGLSLAAGTIQGMPEADERIESIVQPLPGFGGRPAETEMQCAARQNARIHNRHRALTIKDYEQLVLEHFPEVDKVQCIPLPQDKGASEICLVVFSRTEDSRYFLSPVWKLAEIQRLVGQYVPPFVTLRVMNPMYEQVKVHCKAVLWDKVQDESKAIRQLVVLAQNYIALWYRKGEIPTLRQCFSYKELHARMVNHEDLMKLVSLEVNGKSLSQVDIDTKDMAFKGSHPWSVLLPKIEIELLSLHDGINSAEIESNFIIG